MSKYFKVEVNNSSNHQTFRGIADITADAFSGTKLCRDIWVAGANINAKIYDITGDKKGVCDDHIRVHDENFYYLCQTPCQRPFTQYVLGMRDYFKRGLAVMKERFVMLEIQA